MVLFSMHAPGPFCGKLGPRGLSPVPILASLITYFKQLVGSSALQLLLSHRHFINDAAQLAGIPRQRLAQFYTTILAYKNKRKSTRAQRLSQIGHRQRIGIDNNDDVAIGQIGDTDVQQSHLFYKPWVCRAVGKDNDRPMGPQIIIDRYIRG